MSKIKEFSTSERKLEGLQYMQEIIETRKKLGALVQWVKAVYAEEMQEVRDQASQSSSLVPQSNEVFGGD